MLKTQIRANVRPYAAPNRIFIRTNRGNGAITQHCPVARRNRFAVRAAADNKNNEDNEKKLVQEIEAAMKQTGLDPSNAQLLLKKWSSDIGHQVTKDDLRKILVGQSTRTLVLVFISTLLDLGAAYGAFTLGGFLDAAADKYGVAAVVGEAIAYLIAGYYVTGVAFDLFKLGAVVVARFTFGANAGAFLEAIEDIANAQAASGLDIVDKAKEAVNSVKVLSALNKMAEELKRAQGGRGGGEATDMLADLGAYLTLERAQRAYGFDAKEFGVSDTEAANIALLFSKYDANEDGVLSEDEFRKLCAQFAPELTTPEEVKAALEVIDTNKDGSIQFTEFVKFWLKK